MIDVILIINYHLLLVSLLPLLFIYLFVICLLFIIYSVIYQKLIITAIYQYHLIVYFYSFALCLFSIFALGGLGIYKLFLNLHVLTCHLPAHDFLLKILVSSIVAGYIKTCKKNVKEEIPLIRFHLGNTTTFPRLSNFLNGSKASSRFDIKLYFIAQSLGQGTYRRQAIQKIFLLCICKCTDLIASQNSQIKTYETY